MTGIGGPARSPGRAGHARPGHAYRSRTARGSVRLIPRLLAHRRPRGAAGRPQLARIRHLACHARFARRARSVAAHLVRPASGSVRQVRRRVHARDGRRANRLAGMARVGRLAIEAGRARDARATATHHVRPARGAVGDVARLDANGSARVAHGRSGTTGVSGHHARRSGHARRAGSRGAAHHAVPASAAGSHIDKLVGALRCRPGTDQASRVTGVEGGAGTTSGTGHARSFLTHHAYPAGCTVRLVIGLGTNGHAGRALDRARPAWFAGHGAGHPVGARLAISVATHRARAASRAVALQAAGVLAGRHAGGAANGLARVTRIGEVARRARQAGAAAAIGRRNRGVVVGRRAVGRDVHTAAIHHKRSVNAQNLVARHQRQRTASPHQAPQPACSHRNRSSRNQTKGERSKGRNDRKTNESPANRPRSSSRISRACFIEFDFSRAFRFTFNISTARSDVVEKLHNRISVRSWLSPIFPSRSNRR